MPMDAALAQEFRSSIRGEVLDMHATGYDSARSVYNAMIDRRPALIVRCMCTEDVICGVRLARREGLYPSVKGVGTSVAGFGACEGGVILSRRLLSAASCLL